MKRLLVVLFAVGVMAAPGTARAHMLPCSMQGSSAKSFQCALRQRAHAEGAVAWVTAKRHLYNHRDAKLILRNHRWLEHRAQITINTHFVVAGDWRSYLRRLVGESVYRYCALPLIGRESGGVVTKWNYQGSGAYGLGQALPASKMAPYGADYMTNGVTQIRWMDAYVTRYGGWCAANAFQASHNYY